MSLRFYKPYTSGTRNRSVSDFSEITSKALQKSLVFFSHNSKGRNSRGVITCRHRGGGHKRLYRLIDFKRNKLGVKAKVLTIEYDPNRNCRISLVSYEDGEKRYILHPYNLQVNSIIVADFDSPIVIGNTLPLSKVPLGEVVHNIEFRPGRGGQLARSAGTFSRIVAKEGPFVTLRLPSGEIRLVEKFCWATIGQVDNIDFFNINLGKAGRKRWMGFRPTVRGVAMNPCDHPHGGGEGKSPIGRTRPVTPWGKPTLGLKTRSPKLQSNIYIIRNRKFK